MAFDYLGRVIRTVGIVGAVLSFGGGVIAQSQIIPDNTAGSIVVPFEDDNRIDAIIGGFESDGNLLHSFQDFNVAEERGAYFISPTENIQTIFSRVTGDQASNIFGVLGTIGSPAPDLWFINPNGILFGPNAQLDVGGAFLATTADAIQINGLGTITASEISNDTDILTISDSAFLFNRSNPNAKIINQSQSPVLSPAIPLSGFEDFKGLQVLPGETLGVISRDIVLDGGGLNTINGKVFLSAIENVEMANGAAIQAGDILLDTTWLSVQDGSQILTQLIDPRIAENVSYFNNNGMVSFRITPDESLQDLVALEGGRIAIAARESIDISGTAANTQYSSRIGSGALGALRTGGNVTIDTNRLVISDGGQITSNYISVSDENIGGGNIEINSPQIEISGSAVIPSASSPENIERFSGIFVGAEAIAPTNGSVTLFSEDFKLTDGARLGVVLGDQIFSENTPIIPGEINIESISALISGKSPSEFSSFILANRSSSEYITTPIVISTDFLTVQESASIVGQDIKATANETIIIRDDSNISGSNQDISDRSEDPTIEIEAQSLNLQENARISGNKVDINSGFLTVQENAAILGQNLRIIASETVLIEDNSAVGDISQDIFGHSEESVVEIEAKNLRLQENARISGSEIALSARDSLTIEDDARVLTTEETSLFDSQSEAESIQLNGKEIILSDNAVVSSPSITLQGGIATLQDQSSVFANQQSYGSSGDISISVDQLDILDSAQLSASISRPGSGGSIDIQANDAVNIIGDRNAAQPSAIRATSDGPGTGGQISIRTRALDLQNGSQIAASLNGGGTGGSVLIEAEASVNISGQSNRGLPSGIFADSDLSGGEFVVLRSIRNNSQSPQFISMLLDTEVILFTQTPGLIRSKPRTGSTGSNQIFLDYNPPSDEPRSAANLFPQREDISTVKLTLSESVGQSIIQRSFSEGFLYEGFESNDVPTNQAISNGSTAFLIQEVGSARQTLFNHLNVPDDGTLIVGQSMSTDFLASIEGGAHIFPDSEEVTSLRSVFTESLGSVKDIALIELENINTDPNDFAGDRQESIFNDIDAINSAFINNAGELYIVESTGKEFRVKDDRYTDTRFTDIQSGDVFLLFAVRDGGDIDIEAGTLTITDGAEISAVSLGSAGGNAAASNLTIVANDISIRESKISAESGTGTGGNILITAPAFTMTDSTLTTAARGNASGGNISLAANTVQLKGNSDIETNISRGGGGDGGDITLSADYIIAFDDSDLLAFAESGEGGDITLNTPGFFGENYTDASLQATPNTLRGNNRADINATGSVSGDVNTPDVRFIEDSLTDLPDNLIVSEQLIASSCIARAEDGEGTLVTNGSSGLAITPNSALTAPLSTGIVQAISVNTADLLEANSQTHSVSIDEPTGIYQLADGRLVMGKACL